ncbi:MAG: phosphotransferase, partial [Acidimicrobiales bacterium]
MTHPRGSNIGEHGLIETGLDAATLSAWGEVDLLAPASSGTRNTVWFALLNGARCVIRRSTRSDAALNWELDTIDAVRAAGLGAPKVVPAIDGRRSLSKIVVQDHIDGSPPTTTEDWHAVRRYLTELHSRVRPQRQRPGFASAIDLIELERGGDVDLTWMPEGAVERCRAAWTRLDGWATALIHGDPSRHNILITDHGVVLIDWDEA